MEAHLVSRPLKTAFPIVEQMRLRDLAMDAIKRFLLPNREIEKILLIGSSVKGSFGQYQLPGFRGSLYSDFDFIVYVTDGYMIPLKLTRQLDAKPFSRDDLNQAYRMKNVVEEKYDAEVFFVTDRALADASICEEGERAGIPMSAESLHSHIVVFEQGKSH